MHGLNWSLDGQSLLGWRHNGWIVLCPVAGGACRDIVQGALPGFSPDRSRVYFTRRAPRAVTSEIWSIGADGNNEIKIAEVGPLHPINGRVIVAPNGELVWTEFRPGRQELWILER
jgi:hypothetical protein